MRHIGKILLLLSICLRCITADFVAAEGSNTVLVTVKLVKNPAAPVNIPYTIEFPKSCTLCTVVHDQAYERQNLRETILAIRIPTSTPVDVHIYTEAAIYSRVLLETVDLPFQKNTEGLAFTIPSQIADRVNSGEFQTHLYWRGVELRFEHADPERRAGDYAEGDFPVIQRHAADNLEFGLLEAIRELGLDSYVDDENLGRLFLMGFDTNFPHGHRDSPPHFHLVLWLPNYKAMGSLVPHLYLTSSGLISHSEVGMIGWDESDPRAFDYHANQTYTSNDMLGRPVFSLTITKEGWLNLARFDGSLCTLRPVKEGFDSGVRVSCPSFPMQEIQITDNIDDGTMSEWINGKIEAIIHYDKDTGTLLYR